MKIHRTPNKLRSTILIGLLCLSSCFISNAVAATNNTTFQVQGDVAPLGAPDGHVTVADALVTLRMALGLTEQNLAADTAPLCDTDGVISVADALITLRVSLGLAEFCTVSAINVEATLDQTGVTVTWVDPVATIGYAIVIVNDSLIEPLTLEVSGSPALLSGLNIQGDTTFHVVSVLTETTFTISEGVTLNLPNQAPTASVTAPETAPVLSTITLNASGSQDANNDSLSYHWTWVSTPLNSQVQLPAATSDNQIDVTLDALGDYTYSLTVSDGELTSQAVTGTISTTNTQPVAATRHSNNGIVGQAFRLDAGASQDADEHALSYQWRLVSKPVASQVPYAPLMGETADIALDELGDYIYELIVNDGFEDSLPIQTTLHVIYRYTSLASDVIDADYNEISERLVIALSSPRELLVLNQADGTSSRIPYPLNASSVSISPNGMQAVVGHNGWVSVFDLETSTLINTFPVTVDVLDIVMDGKGQAHLFPRVDQWVNIHSLDLTTGIETTSSGSIRAGTYAKLHPSGNSIYGADNGLSPSDIEKYDITSGTAQYLYDSPYHGDYDFCGNLWLSEDGARIFTCAGHVFRSANLQTEDMLYNGALSGVSRIRDLAHSAETGQILLINEVNGLAESSLRFYRDEYLTFEREESLPELQFNNMAWVLSPRFVFYTGDGSSYIVITEGIGGTGILISSSSAGNGTVPVAVTQASQVTPTGTEVILDGSASYDSDGDAFTYQWSLLEAPQGSLAQLQDANLENARFTPDVAGDYLLGLVLDDGTSQSLQATHAVTATEGAGSFELALSYRPIDAEYSHGLDQIVMVSDQPPRLYTFDTQSYHQRQVDLPITPTSISVSPDGLSAAVGHNAYVSHVDLSTLQVLNTWPVTTDALDVILDANQRAHVLPRTGQWQKIRTIDLTNGTETLHSGSPLYAGSLGALHPSGNKLYAANNGLSPSDIERYDINADGTLTLGYDSPYHGDYAMGGYLWFSEDGERIFTRKGFSFRATDIKATDMTYFGAFEETHPIEQLDHSTEAGRVALIPENPQYSWETTPPDTMIRFFDGRFLTHIEDVNLPTILVNNVEHSFHGRFVFYNDDGSQLFVIMQADSAAGLQNDFSLKAF